MVTHGPAAMFRPSTTFSIDESKLCFNKTHFNREDFNVERFMNLARQKADLKTIQQDLRLYLKSVQNSMIELINDDYADFVHLSSNLVSLQESLSKIEQEIDRNWLDFEDSTKESTGMAERIEKKCDELNSNRKKQAELRDQISYLCAIEKLSDILRQPPNKCSLLWLQKVATFVVELKSTAGTGNHSEEERNAERTVLTELEAVLCSEGVRSASTDCQSLPLVFSILSLTDSTHLLTARLVSDLLYSKIVLEEDEKITKEDQLASLKKVYDSVKKMREVWAQTLGEHNFCGKVRAFLDETLLTFVLTFIDKCMTNVAVPSDTRLFHKCFLVTQNFIDTWPSASSCQTMLKSIRDKFNLLVYFKLETHRYGKQVDQLMIPEKFEIAAEQSEDNNEFHFVTTRTIFSAIEHVWGDDVYLPPIIDKLWDFTLRMLLKHYSWCQNLKSYFVETKQDWTLMLFLRTDTEKLHQAVFDFALETIWGKLHDMSVDTAAFGQCMTRHGRVVDELCCKIDEEIVNLFSEAINQELSQVSDVPKQYRWTKRAPPTTNSKYVENAVQMICSFREKIEEKEHPDVEKLIKNIGHFAFSFFVEKAKEVQDGVEATGSSLSRFKRKSTPESALTVSDDDKIKRQIYHDGLFLLENAENLAVPSEDLVGLQEVVNRFDLQKENSSGAQIIRDNANKAGVENGQLEGDQVNF